MNNLPKVKENKSLVEKAYDVIKKAIICMDVEPGQALPEEWLVEQLGISRTPIRSALNKLAHEELVDIYPGRGTFVARVTYDNMVNTLEVREVLEILAARLASRNRSDTKNRKKLKEALKMQESILKTDLDIQLYLEYDNQFHNTISKLADNEVLEKQIGELKDKFNRFVILSKSLQEKKRAVEVIREHKMILEAILKGDTENAVAAMAKHIRNVKAGIEKGLKEYLKG